MSKKKTLVIILIIFVVSAVVIYLIFITEPEAQHETATKKTAMLVDVVPVEKGNYKPTVVATGNVQAAKDIILSTQVGGEVIRISENFTPGSFVKKGEVLLQINPADYRNALQLQKSNLQLAEADLSIEMGRQDVARKDLELVGADLSPDNQALVLRKPQLESAKANVAAAEASVEQAELDLRRTTVRAPFNAHIISRNANEGTQVAPGEEIGRLVGMEEYWVIANVPLEKVHWLSFSQNIQGEGSEVRVINERNWPEGTYRKGELFKLIGALDDQTRLARVLISVPDPLLQNSNNNLLPRLIIGSFVEVQIEAREINNVIRLNRDYLRQDNTVWVMENEKLSIRNVDVVFQDPEFAYIESGLTDNDLVITTDLSTVIEGSELRTGEENNPEENDPSENPRLQH